MKTANPRVKKYFASISAKKYEVTVFTGDLASAETDDRVYLTLIGSEYPLHTCDEVLLTTNVSPDS